MADYLFPSEVSTRGPQVLNPTLFSVGRVVNGVSGSGLLWVNSTGVLQDALPYSSLSSYLTNIPLSSLASQSAFSVLTRAASSSGAVSVTSASATGQYLQRTSNGLEFATPSYSHLTNVPQDLSTTGNVQFGTLNFGGSAPATPSHIYSTDDVSTTNQVALNITFTALTSSTRNTYGTFFNYTGGISSTSSQQFIANYASIKQYVPSGLTNSSISYFNYGDLNINASGHQGIHSGLIGANFLLGFATGSTSGTITNAKGFTVQLTRTGSGLITNFYGLHILESGSTATITNKYGVYENLTSGGVNFFNSPVNIGSATIGPNFLINRNNALGAWSINGPGLRLTNNTYTDSNTADGATVALNFVHTIASPALAASGATASGVVYTNAGTLYLAGNPTTSGLVTLSNPWALYVAAGQSLFRSNIFVGSGSVYNTTNTNANLNSGSGFTGIQIRSAGTSNTPALEFFANSASYSDGANMGELNWFAGTSSVTKIAQIQSLVSGTSENAAHLLFSASTGGTLSERMRIHSGGGVSIGTTVSGAAAQIRGAGTTTGLSLLVENSAGTARLTVRDDGAFAFAGGTVSTAASGFTPNTSGFVQTTSLTSLGDLSTVTATDANFRVLAKLVETLARELVKKGVLSI